jgi:hypothetical protein
LPPTFGKVRLERRQTLEIDAKGGRMDAPGRGPIAVGGNSPLKTLSAQDAH